MLTLLLLLLQVATADVRPLTVVQVCTTRWGADHRYVTLKMRHAVFIRDKVLWAEHAKLIIDHKIPRELGGADVLANLQVQSKAEAHVKDRLEGNLHRRVCTGTLLLKTAQDEIRTD